jgi:tetratricopeptide (TPR) repeat protein
MGVTDERLSKADYYFTHRHKDSSYLYKTKSLCQEVLAENSSNAEALWRMSRVYSAFGYYAESKTEKLSFYEKCKKYAQKAKAADPGSADAHFWCGVAFSRIMQVKGLVSAISSGMEVKKSFERALELDPSHTRAMAALAIWYYEAPAIAGGDVVKSITLLKKALGIDSNYTLLYVYLARCYIKQKNYPAARTQLDKCLAVEKPSSPADFYTQDRPAARKLLAEIEGK